MKKLLLVLLVCLLPALAGCERSRSSANPVYPPGVDPNDPWQRYPDGSPGVIDMRL
ncbi:MAG: hypothetical protein AB1403_00585 [Candidatus Riflebacteria bacterium]